ncbi:MAG: hypothetical protein H6883_11305 [Rhodobiaceae bacterium]|nr:hypothetical protein [Rhodobiaceae bacterium]
MSVLFSLAQGLAASAETLTWHFRNDHPNTVSLELYSEDRDHVWPGGNEVYILDDGNEITISIECNSGESICYGAWVRNRSSTYWGVGYDGEQSCDDCCYTCDGGETELSILDQ